MRSSSWFISYLCRDQNKSWNNIGNCAVWKSNLLWGEKLQLLVIQYVDETQEFVGIDGRRIEDLLYLSGHALGESRSDVHERLYRRIRSNDLFV